MPRTFSVQPVCADAARLARERIDHLTKPVGSLGRIEELAERLAAIAGALPAGTYERRSIVIFAGDHGVTEEGVSAYPSEVTAQMLGGFLHGTAAISAFARAVRARVHVANVGVAADVADAPGLFNVNVARGTRNLARGAAMTTGEAEAAIETGATVVEKVLSTDGCQAIAFGEMGIGNTTSAAALICALTGTDAELIAGRGTGIDDETLLRKIAAVRAGTARCEGAGWEVCAREVGGLEILALAGGMLAAAQARIPVVLDGFIVTAAGLLASHIEPDVTGYFIASHRSRELGHAFTLRQLGLTPLYDLDLRLGEATGAALAFPLIEAAARMIGEMHTFEEAGVSTASATPVPATP